jgi:hypothetical protein
MTEARHRVAVVHVFRLVVDEAPKTPVAFKRDGGEGR